ncbi:MAG: AraC family transcriptional regulator [Steroidobacteraceae bacterium]|jgi:AraC-like DNA-binding protein|nr:AraC family transcriptional regulator [Steroidobacteraceae bacterium]
MDDSAWTVDWGNAHASAPPQGRSVLRGGRSELHCERVSLTAGLALCQLEGRCPRPMLFEAPAAGEPRAHLQFLAGGAGRLVDSRGEHDLLPRVPTLFRPPAGGVAWRIAGGGRVDVISVDVTASALRHWCDSAEAHALLFDAGRTPTQFSSGAQRALYSHLRLAVSIERERDAGWRLQAESLALQALATGLERLGLGAVRSGIGAGDAVRLRRARECLEDSPAPPSTMLALAQAVGLPVRRLQRLYECYHGEALREAVYRARLEAARRALLEGGTSVKQVARAAGFLHATSFTHAFKAYWGHAPSALTSRRSRR